MFSALRHEATYQVGGAEEFDASSVRVEARPELENLAALGRGLCWCGAFSAETSNDECRNRKQQLSGLNFGLVGRDHRSSRRTYGTWDLCNMI